MSDTSSLIYGSDLMIFVGSGTTVTPLAYTTSAKLSISMGTKDVSSKDSGNYAEKVGTRFDWNASSDGFTSYTVTGNTNSIDEVFVLQALRQPVNVTFGFKTGVTPSWTVDATKRLFKGTALITSIDVNADNDGSSTYSIKLEGTGALILV